MKRQRKESRPDEEIDNDEEERELTALLFGARDPVHFQNQDLFVVDAKGEAEAAWMDSDDENVKVDLSKSDRLRKLRNSESEKEVNGVDFTSRLRKQHAKMMAKNSSWAKVKPEDDDDEDESVLKQTNSLLHTKTPKHKNREALLVGKVHMSRLQDAAQPSKCVIQALDWHHTTSSLFLSGGFDRTLKLFQLEEKKANKLVQSVFFQDLPIFSAKFVGDSSIVLSGRRPFYYLYDVESGVLNKAHGILGRKDQKSLETIGDTQGDMIAFVLKDGFVSLVHAKSQLETGFCKSGTQVSHACFVGQHVLVTGGSDGEIRGWDRRKLSLPLWKREDEASLKVTALGCTEQVYAVGSESGVVNVYAMDTGVKLKTVMNLKTYVDNCVFNSEGNLLSMSSREKPSALKLLHLETNQVVNNWPDFKTKLGHVSKVNFSKKGGVLSVGNDRGQVLLWRMGGFQ